MYMRSAVAPHAGAWIETADRALRSCRSKVAPHAGAWIETSAAPKRWTATMTSHPTRVRGSKPRVRQGADYHSASHPTRVRGSKHSQILTWVSQLTSHPTRVRGSKRSALAVQAAR